jgi:hypothetical protein
LGLGHSAFRSGSHLGHDLDKNRREGRREDLFVASRVALANLGWVALVQQASAYNRELAADQAWADKMADSMPWGNLRRTVLAAEQAWSAEKH